MSTWGFSLYANDTTCDVRDIYMNLLRDQVEDVDAYEQTLEQCADYIGDQDEPLLWYALAECQWSTGRLLPEVKEKALWWIEQRGGLELWEETLSKSSGWEKTLQNLKEKIESPMPARKNIKRRKEINRNPWRLNDIYAYQLHTDEADASTKGKYIAIQKIGEAEVPWGEGTAMRVQIFDELFSSVPLLSDLAGVRILPIDYPSRSNISGDGPVEYFRGRDLTVKKVPIGMCALITLESMREYPAKHLTYIGNQQGPPNKMGNDQLLYWSRIESSIYLFRSLWKEKQYDTLGDGIYDYVQPQNEM